MSKGIREAPGKALIGDLAAESGDRTEGAFGKPAGLLLTALSSRAQTYAAESTTKKPLHSLELI